MSAHVIRLQPQQHMARSPAWGLNHLRPVGHLLVGRESDASSLTGVGCKAEEAVRLRLLGWGVADLVDDGWLKLAKVAQPEPSSYLCGSTAVTSLGAALLLAIAGGCLSV